MTPKTMELPENAQRFPLATWAQVRREIGAQVRAVPGARRLSLVALLLMALGAWATVSVPRLLGQTVDVVRQVTTGESSESVANSRQWRQLMMDTGLGLIGAKMLVAAMLGGVASAAGYYLMSKVSERIIANLRETMVGTALGLPLHQVEDAGTADLVSRSTDDVAEVSAAITETLPLLSKSVFLIVATATALISIDPRLLLCTLVAFVPYWWGARRYLRIAPERFAAERAGMAERARRVLEAIHGRATIRAFRMENTMHERIESASWDVVTKGLRARMALLRLQLWVTAGEFLLTASVLVGGFYFVRAGWVSVGAVTGAGLMVIRLRGPIMHVMRELDVIQSAYASLARIVGVSVDPPQQVPDYVGAADVGAADTPVSSSSASSCSAPGQPSLPGAGQQSLRGPGQRFLPGAGQRFLPGAGQRFLPGAGQQSLPAASANQSPAVELRHVTFRYAGSSAGFHVRGSVTAVGPVDGPVDGITESATGSRVAVDDVSFRVYPGQTVALVGASGAGKTTVASLLMGLRVPDSGEVLVAGAPVSLLSDAQRSQRIAMVTQEVHTFAGTLREDLNLAKPDVTDEQIREAVARVGALDWLDSLPEGLDTVVGEQGMRLNPVVAQQLALARVLLMDPPVVVMDEATAEAGSAQATALEDAAAEVLRDRSALVVAHRLDQARAADRVLVMEAGRIVESGPHDQLVSQGGRYAEMWAAWMRGRES
ncbi:ABC transporter ATP-binding protein [Corynebacterium auriscanis]|uniref:ABC transporter ATP-binding protein n=1 Tax=Corynebacterium auriscanis TaxID=99807 RepID=UPI0025B521CF|nr:ABC transporter transmembrane domain-containing protein [Corynebacterium auriscanis]